MNPQEAVRLAFTVYSDNLNIYQEKFNALKITEIDVENDYGVVLERKDDAVICIAGSDDLQDWFDNFKIISEHIPNYGKMHFGFYESFCDINIELSRCMSKIDRRKPIKVIGHSKGGAIAEIISFYLRNTARFDDVELFTFGSPRVGKGEWHRRFLESGIKYSRYVNGKDPVPRVPRNYMGYIHVSDPKLMQDGWFSWLWVGDFADHSIKRYIKSIDKLNL